MPAVTRTDLGAWLVRADPRLRDLPGHVRAGNAPFTSWCVAASYRSRLMEPGDEIWLWVSGRDPTFPRGLWGWGAVVGPAEPDEHPPGERPTWRVSIELRVCPDESVTDHELREAGITDLEVQRMPQGSNPSWVSRDQLARIVPLRGRSD